MAQARAVSVDDDPVALVSQGRKGTLRNDGADTVYVGGADVDASTHGFSVPVDGVVNFDLSGGDALYAICDTGDSCTLSVLEAEPL